MRKITIFLFAVISFSSCEKENNVNVLNISGVRTGGRTEIVNIKLKSGETKSSEIDCYVMGSTLFEPSAMGFGYVDCNANFNLVNPLTGELVNQFPLPGLLSQTVIDTVENVLIGQYHADGSNHIVKLDMADGEVKAQNAVDLGEGVIACTYFYNHEEREYVLLKVDSTLICLNADNGAVTRSVKMESLIDNATYDVYNRRLIGVTYSEATDQNHIETIDVDTGVLISKAKIGERNDYYGCVTGYDRETNCYILVNPQNKILFIDIDSGEIKDSYIMDFAIKEFKFWRSI